MRLIDADALKDSLRDSFEACQRWADGAKDEERRIRAEASRDTFLEAILRTNGMPTVDPAVRCKDCKKEALCRRHWDKDEDWYCADGERKDGDGDGN